MGGGPQRSSLTSLAGLGSHCCFLLATYTQKSRRATYSDHLRGDVANAASPARRGLVQDIVNPETGILLGKRIEVLLEQDILGGDVGEDEVNLGLVTSGTATNDGTDDLQHGSDTSATSDHTKVTDHVGSVDESALGSLDAQSLANAEGSHVLGDVAGGVRLDEQVEVAGLVVTGDGGVGPDDLLGGAIGLGQLGANGDVLADGKAEDRVRGGEGETVAEDVVSVRATWWKVDRARARQLTWLHCER